MSNPLVKQLVQAIRDIGNRNGRPIPGYYDATMRLEQYTQREVDIQRLVANAIALCPKEALEE